MCMSRVYCWYLVEIIYEGEFSIVKQAFLTIFSLIFSILTSATFLSRILITFMTNSVFICVFSHKIYCVQGTLWCSWYFPYFLTGKSRWKPYCSRMWRRFWPKFDLNSHQKSSFFDSTIWSKWSYDILTEYWSTLGRNKPNSNIPSENF